MIKIAIVDDRKIIRQNITAEVAYSKKIEVVFTAQNGLEFLEKYKTTPIYNKPEIVLMDIDMPEKNGIDTVRDAKLIYPEVEFLMLTVFDEDDKIFEAIRAGASGYLLKDESVQTIMQHIEQVKQYQTVPMSPAIARKALQLLSNTTENKKQIKTDDYGLTNRQKQILKGLVDGLHYKEIAQKLEISPFTVRNIITKIYKKLYVSSKVDAVKIALQNNIV